MIKFCSIFPRPKKKQTNDNNNNNNDYNYNNKALFQARLTPLTSDQCLRTNATKSEREKKEKENGQRQKERKKKNFRGKKKSQTTRAQLFSSHLRRFCTRRWLLFGTARLPRRPCSSVRLSICPSFSFSCGLFVRLMTIEFVLFPSFLEVERSEKKGPIFLYVFYVNYARQNVYNNNIHLL